MDPGMATRPSNWRTPDGWSPLHHGEWVHWFVSDALPVLKENEAKGEAFQVVELKLGPGKEADLTIGDGNDHLLYKKHIGYTDAKAKPKLYFTDNVLMLSGEY